MEAIDLSDPEITHAWRTLTSRTGDVNWILFGFADPRSHKLVVNGMGSGGVEELNSKLNPDEIQYGAFKVTRIVEDPDESRRRRSDYVWVVSIGPRVSVLRKARVSTERPEVAKLFAGALMWMEVQDGVIPKDEVVRRLLLSSGRQRATAYEFAPGDVVPVP